MLVVCSNYISTIKQNVKGFSQNHSPLPPPVEDKKPALPSEWSFGDTDRINADEIDGSCTVESPKVDNEPIKRLLTKSRPIVDHGAFDLDICKKPANTKMKRQVDEMVKNGTPYLAMHLCPVYKLELSKNFEISETTKTKFPFMEKINDTFCDGIAYDEKLEPRAKKEIKEKPINVTNLMEIVDQLELDEDDDIERIIYEHI